MSILNYKNWKISTKVISMSLFTILVLILGISLYFLPLLASRIMEEKRSQTESVVDIAYNLIYEYDARAKKGEFSIEEAQKRAVARIKELRYKKDEYFWINDMQPIMIMHPTQPQLDGKDLNDYKDPNGKKLFVAMVNVCKEKGSGFVDYDWPRPGQTKPVPKISYVKLYQPWGWIIGSGIYVDDVKTQIATVRNVVLIATGIGIILLLIINLVWVRAVIVKPLSAIETVINNVKKGNYADRIKINSRDEFYDIAETFNETMDRMTVLIQTEEERKKMQNDIIRFLNILSAASEGDLSQTAEVTPDIFGSLADAFNLMVEGLAVHIKAVKESAEGANNSSQSLADIIAKLETGADMQKTEVKTASEAVKASADSAGQIAEKTKVAQRISEDAFTAINRGGKIVSDSINGMQLIRVTVQAINKRMKLLAEKLMEIGIISQLISEIANRTNLLALNASIEAARAGEQGKGFVIIADEIRGLAERSSKSTKQITDIIGAIQTEAATVTKHLEEETNYVEMETNMASDTGTIFGQIETIIKNIGSITTEIDSATNEQKGITTKVSLSMEEVQRISQEVLNIVHDLTEISTVLSDSSKSLLTSTARFKF
ncbi:MAG TPA: methyl-accepting chemotaxis protein [Dissulfurispiraceae bacterium]|nr:methyl-accepting chemotaxis protein [Dissulfurispiraceae bacterium]